MPWGATAGGLLLLGALAVAAVTLIGIDSAIELDGVRVVPVILQSATAPPVLLLGPELFFPWHVAIRTDRRSPFWFSTYQTDE